MALGDTDDRPVRIAIIDYEEAGIRILQQSIRLPMPEATLVTSTDGRDAVALRFADPPPDLMLINGLMPRMDGWEAVREIRLREQGDDPHVPLVFQTGMGRSSLHPPSWTAWTRGWRRPSRSRPFGTCSSGSSRLAPSDHEGPDASRPSVLRPSSDRGSRRRLPPMTSESWTHLHVGGNLRAGADLSRGHGSGTER
jgi:CheY-like chemotaxis protein